MDNNIGRNYPENGGPGEIVILGGCLLLAVTGVIGAAIALVGWLFG